MTADAAVRARFALASLATWRVTHLRLGHLTQEWLATSDDPEARTSGLDSIPRDQLEAQARKRAYSVLASQPRAAASVQGVHASVGGVSAASSEEHFSRIWYFVPPSSPRRPRKSGMVVSSVDRSSVADRHSFPLRAGSERARHPPFAARASAGPGAESASGFRHVVPRATDQVLRTQGSRR